MAYIIHMPPRRLSGAEHILRAAQQQMDLVVEMLEDEIREAATSGEALAVRRRLNYMTTQLEDVYKYAAEREAELCGRVS